MRRIGDYRVGTGGREVLKAKQTASKAMRVGLGTCKRRPYHNMRDAAMQKGCDPRAAPQQIRTHGTFGQGEYGGCSSCWGEPPEAEYVIESRKLYRCTSNVYRARTSTASGLARTSINLGAS